MCHMCVQSEIIFSKNEILLFYPKITGTFQTKEAMMDDVNDSQAVLCYFGDISRTIFLMSWSLFLSIKQN